MLDDPQREAAAHALGRALIAAVRAHPIPARDGEAAWDAGPEDSAWLGRMIGLGLVVGGVKEGFNLNVLMGVGQAVGEVLQADARRTPLASMRAVMLEDFAMGMAQGAEGAKWKPPIHA